MADKVWISRPEGQMVCRRHTLAKWAVECKCGIYLCAIESQLDLIFPKLTLPLDDLCAVAVALGQIVCPDAEADLLAEGVVVHNLDKSLHKVVGAEWVYLHIRIGIDIVGALEQVVDATLPQRKVADVPLEPKDVIGTAVVVVEQWRIARAVVYNIYIGISATFQRGNKPQQIAQSVVVVDYYRYPFVLCRSHSAEGVLHNAATHLQPRLGTLYKATNRLWDNSLYTLSHRLSTALRSASINP